MLSKTETREAIKIIEKHAKTKIGAIFIKTGGKIWCNSMPGKPNEDIPEWDNLSCIGKIGFSVFITGIRITFGSIEKAAEWFASD